MADLEGRRDDARAGRSRARSKNLPLRVSRRCRSIALCWCRFSAVLTRFRGLDLGLVAVAVAVVVVLVLVVAVAIGGAFEVASTGRAGEGKGCSVGEPESGENCAMVDNVSSWYLLMGDIFLVPLAWRYNVIYRQVGAG